MKKVIIIRGPLGVGKSTIAKLLAKKLHAEYLSIDKILKDSHLEGTGGIPLENYLKSNEIILHLISNSKKTCIIDGCFYYQEQIDDLRQKIEDNITIFTLISRVDICIMRDSNRDLSYGEDAARFVHMITMKVKAGHEIDNSNLTIQETVEEIMEKILL